MNQDSSVQSHLLATRWRLDSSPFMTPSPAFTNLKSSSAVAVRYRPSEPWAGSVLPFASFPFPLTVSNKHCPILPHRPTSSPSRLVPPCLPTAAPLPPSSPAFVPPRGGPLPLSFFNTRPPRLRRRLCLCPPPPPSSSPCRPGLASILSRLPFRLSVRPSLPSSPP